MFVKHCLICEDYLEENVDNTGICQNCWKQIYNDFIDSYASRCPKCFSPVQSLDLDCPFCNQNNAFRNYSISFYDSWSRNILEMYKFNDKKQLADVISKIYEIHIKKINLNNPIIIPIPCSYNSLKRRGWDHMELIAEKLPYDYKIIFQHKNEIEQKNSNREQRKNKKLYFNNTKFDDLSNKNIVIIDDVITTGSTLSTAYKLLRKHTNSNILAMTWLKKI